MKHLILVPLLAFGLWAQGTPNCSQALSFTSASAGTAINTIAGAAAGCAGWRLTWSVTGFTAATIQLEGSQDNSSWSAFSGATIVLEGSNPTSWTSATASNTIVVRASQPYVRVNITGVTGSGTIKTLILGYSGTSAQLDNGSGGGGGGSCAALGGDLSGTCTAATVVGIQGHAVASVQGNGTKAQLSTGSTTTNDCVKFDANGNTVDAGAACGTGGAGGSGGTSTGYSASNAISAGTTYFLAPVGGAAASTTEANVQGLANVAAPVSNLQVRVTAAPGVGNSIAVTMRDAGSDTALTCTISGGSATTCSDVTHSFTPVVGDLIDFKVVDTGVTATDGFVITYSYGGGVGPGAQAHNTGTQSITNGGGTATLTFNANDWDTGTIHSTSVNPTRFTAPSSGFYMAGCQFSQNSNATGNIYLALNVNGSTVANVANNSGGFTDAAFSGFIVKLSAGDFVEWVVTNFTTATWSTGVGAQAQLTKLSATF